MRFSTYTLGCKVNQYETEAVEEMLEAAGYIRDQSDEADIALINTCTVTNTSDQKSRQIIRRHKRKRKDCIVVVLGCYAQVSPEEVAAVEGVDLVLGTKNRANLLEDLEAVRRGEGPIVDVEEHERTDPFEALHVEDAEARTRAYMKVQDGCNRYCSYCIIPYARGFIRSRAIDDAVKEARCLAQNGFREVVLTGIHIGSYGKDLDEAVELIDLIEAIGAVDGILRIRLSSVEPMTITDEFLQRVQKIPSFMPHFHLSLQSGSKKVLEEMNRKYTPAEYKETVENIRRYFPDAGITTDVIAGFPGETEEEFEEGLAFVRDIGFSDLHVFPYSMRKNTPAAKREDQIPKAIKNRRAQRLIEAGKEMHKKFAESMVGRRFSVLFEEEKDGKYYGFTPNYLRVFVESDEDLHNAVRCVTIQGIREEEIIAVLGKE